MGRHRQVNTGTKKRWRCWLRREDTDATSNAVPGDGETGRLGGRYWVEQLYLDQIQQRWAQSWESAEKSEIEEWDKNSERDVIGGN